MTGSGYNLQGELLVQFGGPDFQTFLFFSLTVFFLVCATQKSKQARQRLVEPSTDLQLIADASSKVEAQLEVLLSKFCLLVIVYSEKNKNK